MMPGVENMNVYVDIISGAINYIESNIHERISLEDLASRFCVSKFHFDRMFKTVSGMTLKQYILGRKLTEALSYLNGQGVSVIDTAYEFGFDYPEVFSRAFKKQFGISPSAYKCEKTKINPVNEMSIVERDIVSYKGSLTLKGTFIYSDEIYLQGTQVEVDINSEEFEPTLKSAGDTFYEKCQDIGKVKPVKLYTVVNCQGVDNGRYSVFYGIKDEQKKEEAEFEKRVVPSGWYARFIYGGDMFKIRESFVDDLYRWIMVKEILLNPNGVGMLNIFEEDYINTNVVQILVPVKEPRT
jgi:AraC family transcriptional regulator